MRMRTPRQSLVMLAVSVLAGLPASGGPTHAQSPAPTVKVPQNYDECYDLFTDLIAQWAENMVGGEYQQFLKDTNFDHIIPQLCKQGQYEQVYNIAKGFLATPSKPSSQQKCEMSDTIDSWSVYADERFYRMQTQGKITFASDKPRPAGQPTNPISPLQPKPSPQEPKPSALFSIDVRGAVGTGTVTRIYGVAYDFGWNPAPDLVEVALTPDNGAPRRASAKVSGNSIDLTPAFEQPGSNLAIPEYGFGRKAQIKIDRLGATLLTMDILFDGLGGAEHDGAIAHSKFAELSGLSRCAPHDGYAPARRAPRR